MTDAAGPRNYFDLHMEASDVFALGTGSVAVMSLRCPEADSANEDSAAVIPVEGGGGVLAVADGFGGRPGGERASRLALESLEHNVIDADRKHVLARDAILDGFERGNEAVMAMGIGSATTLVAADVVGGRLRTYNVGDSMLIVVGQRGKLKLRTLPHSPVGYAIEAGVLDEEEAMHHEDRHYVSNMVGSPEMRIELTVSLELDPLDTVVLGSDGLWDNLHLEEVTEAVRTGPLEETVAQLMTACIKRMGEPNGEHPSKPDDCTIVLYRPQPYPGSG